VIVKSPLGHDFTGKSDPHPLSSDDHHASKKNYYKLDTRVLMLTAWRVSLVAGTAGVSTLDGLASAEGRRVMWLDLNQSPHHRSPNHKVQLHKMSLTS